VTALALVYFFVAPARCDLPVSWPHPALRAGKIVSIGGGQKPLYHRKIG